MGERFNGCKVTMLNLQSAHCQLAHTLPTFVLCLDNERENECGKNVHKEYPCRSPLLAV